MPVLAVETLPTLAWGWMWFGGEHFFFGGVHFSLLVALTSVHATLFLFSLQLGWKASNMVSETIATGKGLSTIYVALAGQTP